MGTFNEWWEALSAWQKTGFILAGGVLVHLVFKVIILRGLNKFARATENDLDDRLVHFIRRFYIIALFFALVALILNANGIEITPNSSMAAMYCPAQNIQARLGETRQRPSVPLSRSTQ